jgi:surface polysaccharide O-acyltransferase-like enzyme
MRASYGGWVPRYPGGAATPAVSTGRWRELDVLRTVVVVGLVFFHAALVFDTNDDFYVKNDHTTEVTTYLAALAVVWAMPSLFMVAGLGTWYSLQHRGAGGFLRARLLRLGVPLVVATVTIVPVPVWFRLRGDPDYHQSYLQFWPTFFDARLDWSDFPFMLEGERFETGHLWFVELLVSFSVVLLPGLLWLRSDRGRGWVSREPGRAGGTVTLLLPALPLAVVGAALPLEEDIAVWNRWSYLVFFCYGALLAADPRLPAALAGYAGRAATAGLPVFVTALWLLAARDAGAGDPFVDHDPVSVAARVCFGVAGWLWVAAIVGLLARHRRRPPRRAGAVGGRLRWLFGYLDEAALPFYVLHQPILVAIAFYVVRTDLPALGKYLLIVAVSLAVILLVYDVGVRRTAPTRWLFGLAPDPHKASARTPVSAESTDTS